MSTKIANTDIEFYAQIGEFMILFQQFNYCLCNIVSHSINTGFQFNDTDNHDNATKLLEKYNKDKSGEYQDFTDFLLTNRFISISKIIKLFVEIIHIKIKNINPNKFSTFSRDIDKLVNLRNDIAHRYIIQDPYDENRFHEYLGGYDLKIEETISYRIPSCLDDLRIERADNTISKIFAICIELKIPILGKE